MRVFESTTNRGRGGSRSGVSKFLSEQVSGTNPIQGMFSIVRTDGNALGFAFQGQEFRDTGLYGGLDLSTTPGPGDDFPAGGGGGYQPSISVTLKKPRLSLSVDHTTRPADGSTVAVITATVIDGDGNPYPLQNVKLHTSPGGREGDDKIATTTGGGTTTFDVHNDREETVTYIGTVESVLGTVQTRSRNSVKVAYANVALFLSGDNNNFTVPSGSLGTVNFTVTVSPPSERLIRLETVEASGIVRFEVTDSITGIAIFNVQEFGGEGGGIPASIEFFATDLDADPDEVSNHVTINWTSGP